MQKNIAIFASGSGSNAESIMLYFKSHATIKVALIVSNNSNAGVLERAKKFDIPYHIYHPSEQENLALETVLSKYQIDFIVLAGYLKKIPDSLIHAFEHKIVNIHPALLPKFGGKGMYGMNVHRAVVNAGEKKSGMTIHYVNENYDEGGIIEQRECTILPTDTAEIVQQNVLKLEHEFFAPCIEKLITNGI